MLFRVTYLADDDATAEAALSPTNSAFMEVVRLIIADDDDSLCEGLTLQRLRGDERPDPTRPEMTTRIEISRKAFFHPSTCRLAQQRVATVARMMLPGDTAVALDFT